jgi:hypothetical protein
MESSNPRPTATIFQANINGMVSLINSFNRVPRFLFRTTAPATPAITTLNRIQSPAAKHGYDISDILGRPFNTTRSMLVEHFSWSNEIDNNLVSWTSSLAYAIQLALFRESRDYGAPKDDDIHIWVIDTYRLPKEAFLPAVELLAAYAVPNAYESKRVGRQIRFADYQHEYVAQGEMNIPQFQQSQPILQCTSLRALRRNGLNNFFEEVNYNTLRSRIITFRKEFSEQPRTTPTGNELCISWSLSDNCFPNSYFRPILMANLLSLKPRPQSDFNILDMMYESRWSKSYSFF